MKLLLEPLGLLLLTACTNQSGTDPQEDAKIIVELHHD